MYSLFDKNRGAKAITVYVLSLGLSEENIGKLQTIANIFNRELVILELGDIRKRFDFDVDTGGYDISIMGRLFMGEMLPEHVDRVLYLDCDTVIVRSIENMWKESLGGAILGAVMEPTIYEAVKESKPKTMSRQLRKCSRSPVPSACSGIPHKNAKMDRESGPFYVLTVRRRDG